MTSMSAMTSALLNAPLLFFVLGALSRMAGNAKSRGKPAVDGHSI